MVGDTSLIVVVVVGATWRVGVTSSGVVSVGVVVIVLGESSGVVRVGVVVIALAGESSGVSVLGDSNGVLVARPESAGATVVLGPALSCSEERGPPLSCSAGRGPGGKGVGPRPNTAPGGATSTGATPRAATNAV